MIGVAKVRLAQLSRPLLIGFLFAAQPAAAADLPMLNIDAGQISVSGLSSGGYMAVQFEVAYSSLVMGAGVIAGGPYFCAQGRLEIASPNCVCFPILACTFVPVTTRNIPRLIEITDRNAASGVIDDTANLRAHRVWMFSGKFDSTVRQEVMDDLRTYYLHYVDAANIAYKNDLVAEHAMPTDFFGPEDCLHIGDPYINNCRFDAAGALLSWIYGLLEGGRSEPRGDPVPFSQEKFLSDPVSHGLALEGFSSRRLPQRQFMPAARRVPRLRSISEPRISRCERQDGAVRPDLRAQCRIQSLGRPQPSRAALSAGRGDGRKPARLLGLVGL